MAEAQHKLKPAVSYVLIKLSGAGVSFAAFFAYMGLAVGFDMFKLAEEASRPAYWFIFFGYGVGCSVMIDLLAAYVPTLRSGALRMTCHAGAGCAYFLATMRPLAFALIAGAAGALCAIVFYFGTRLAKRSAVLKYGFGLVLPLLLLGLVRCDFTVKKMWAEELADFSYTAEFAYFNGKHEIPVSAAEGQSIAYTVEMTSRNGGGYGYYVLDDSGGLAGSTEDGPGARSIRVSKSGVYRIVVTGDRLQGGFKVSWTVK